MRLAGCHVLERVLRWPAAVSDRDHRLAAVAGVRLADLGGLTPGSDRAHVVAVRPVARERADGRQVARPGVVEPLDRPTVDAGVLLVGLGLV